MQILGLYFRMKLCYNVYSNISANMENAASPIYPPENTIANNFNKKCTPSTSTKKKIKRSSDAVVVEEEYTYYSPGSNDSVFEFSEIVKNGNFIDKNKLQPAPQHWRVSEELFDEENANERSDDEGKAADVTVRRVESKKSPKSTITSVSGGAVCRICHGSEKSSLVAGEHLIYACHCRGTMGLFHRSCLEKWLSLSNRTFCEICKFQYVTKRIPKSFWQYIRHPGSQLMRRNIVGDFVCFFVLTPLTLASSWLCVSGAFHYADNENDTVEVPGLLCLAVFLILTYVIWLTVTCRYHLKVWQDWRSRNQIVRVLDITEIKRRNEKRKMKMDGNTKKQQQIAEITL